MLLKQRDLPMYIVQGSETSSKINPSTLKFFETLLLGFFCTLATLLILLRWVLKGP